MTSSGRNVVVTAVACTAVAFAVVRFTSHLQQQERDAAALLREKERQTLQLRRDRQASFQKDCRAQEGRILFACPDVCVKQDALISVMP